jgi:hypothetical protein
VSKNVGVAELGSSLAIRARSVLVVPVGIVIVAHTCDRVSEINC